MARYRNRMYNYNFTLDRIKSSNSSNNNKTKFFNVDNMWMDSNSNNKSILFTASMSCNRVVCNGLTLAQFSLFMLFFTDDSHLRMHYFPINLKWFLLFSNNFVAVCIAYIKESAIKSMWLTKCQWNIFQWKSFLFNIIHVLIFSFHIQCIWLNHIVIDKQEQMILLSIGTYTWDISMGCISS